MPRAWGSINLKVAKHRGLREGRRAYRGDRKKAQHAHAGDARARGIVCKLRHQRGRLREKKIGKRAIGGGRTIRGYAVR